MVVILPVKHSTNLKPSAEAMASSILELTVDATIAKRSAAMHMSNNTRIEWLYIPSGLPSAL